MGSQSWKPARDTSCPSCQDVRQDNHIETDMFSRLSRIFSKASSETEMQGFLSHSLKTLRDKKDANIVLAGVMVVGLLIVCMVSVTLVRSVTRIGEERKDNQIETVTHIRETKGG